jgi:hypothetical protein
MVDVGMSSTPLKLLGGKLVYKLKVLLGYQRILDPKGVQTFNGRGIKKKKGLYESGR